MAEFSDMAVIYPSDDDGHGRLWIAHSIRTDQVGVGEGPFEAVRELMMAVRALLEEAGRDPRVRVEQAAPIEVLRRLPNARQLPEAIWNQVKASVQSCIHHDADYWKPLLDDADHDAAEWDDGQFYREIESEDLCAA